jgi:hypothetical protein
LNHRDVDEHEGSQAKRDYEGDHHKCQGTLGLGLAEVVFILFTVVLSHSSLDGLSDSLLGEPKDQSIEQLQLNVCVAVDFFGDNPRNHEIEREGHYLGEDLNDHEECCILERIRKQLVILGFRFVFTFIFLVLVLTHIR